MASVDGRIILKWILRKWDVKRRWEDNIKMDREDVKVWTGSVWLRIGTGGWRL